MIDLRGLIFGVVLVLGVSLMIEGADPTDPNRVFFVLGCFLVGVFAVEVMER